MDLRQFCKLYRDITKQLRHTHSHKDEEWERVDCIGEVRAVVYHYCGHRAKLFISNPSGEVLYKKICLLE